MANNAAGLNEEEKYECVIALLNHANTAVHEDIKNNHPEKCLFKFIDAHTTQLAHHPKDYRDKIVGTDTSVRAKKSLVMTSDGETLDKAKPMKMFLMGMYGILGGWEVWWFWDQVHAERNSF